MSAAEMLSVRAALASADVHSNVQWYSGAVEAAGIYPPRLLWMRGVLAAIDGDSVAMTAARAELVAREWSDRRDPGFVSAFVRELDAELLRRSSPVIALAALGEADIEPGNTFPQIMSFPSGRERYVRAALSAAAGRSDEAIRWWGSFPDPSSYDAWFLPGALIERAGLLAVAGDTARARADYARFIELWKDCDPELRPIVRQAQERLAALR